MECRVIDSSVPRVKTDARTMLQNQVIDNGSILRGVTNKLRSVVTYSQYLWI